MREYVERTLNIYRFIYILDQEDLENDEFINIIRRALNRINRTSGYFPYNIRLAFISEDDRLLWRSYESADIEQALVEEVIVNQGSGSYDVIMRSVMIYNTFEILCRHLSGGNGVIFSDYFEIVNIPSDDNNCLINCFNYICNENLSPEYVRRQIGCKPTNNIGIRNIPKLEKLYKVNVCVVEDYVCDDGLCVIYGKHNKNMILYKNEHFSIVENIKDNINMSTTEDSYDREGDTYYYFYDYETVYDPQTFKLLTYSWAIVKYDRKGNKINEWFSFYDEKEFIRILFLENNKHKDDKLFLTGYNNSRFDNFFLLELSMKYHMNCKNIRIVDNTILNMEIFGFKVKDLCRILNMPLRKALQSFKCKTQKEFISHEEVQLMYNTNKLSKWIENNHTQLRSYNISDCNGLAELYFKTKESLKELIGVDIDDHSTTAGISYSIFKDLHNKKLNEIKNDIITKHQDMSLEKIENEIYQKYSFPMHHKQGETIFVRSSIYGGRSQIFNPGEYKTPLTCIDCVSLYPYVMMNNSFPTGQCKNYSENHKIYVLKCDIKDENIIKTIPFRSKEEPLNWNRSEKKCFINNSDYVTNQKNNNIESFDKGIGWDNHTDDLFSEYFKPLVEEKKRQDILKENNSDEHNPCIRELCKLLMNALSGKLIQRDYDTTTKICETEEQVEEFLMKYKNIHIINNKENNYTIMCGTKKMYNNDMPTIYGSLIYAYARSHMYNSILTHYNNEEWYSHIFGMDTDSAFITTESQQMLKNQNPSMFGNEFGQFKEEIYEEAYGIFVKPKCYCFYKPSDKSFIKARWKGVNIHRDKWIKETKIAEKIRKNELNGKELHNLYYYGNLEQVTVETYRTALNNKVYFLCSILTKKVMDINNQESIKLKNMFYLKEFNPLP